MKKKEKVSKNEKLTFDEVLENRDSERNNLINSIIHYTNIIDDLWSYHPDNPQHLLFMDYYNEMMLKKEDLEVELEKMDLKEK